MQQGLAQLAPFKQKIRQIFPVGMPTPFMESALESLAEVLGPGWQKPIIKKNKKDLNGTFISVLVVYEPTHSYFTFMMFDDGQKVELEDSTVRLLF